MGEQAFSGQIYGVMFDMGTNNQITQGGEIMVIKRFQRSIQNGFSLIDSDLGYSYIIWKVNTINLKNTFDTLCLWSWGFHVKHAFFSEKILVVISSLISWL